MDGSVLIVDEDVNAQIIAETLLRLRGLDVQRATDGAQACDLLRRQKIAVVVLNLNSPGVDGLDFLHLLRGRVAPVPRQPRILVIANRETPQLERFALRLGADAFLRVPLDPRRFIKAVETLAGGAAPQAA